jgi:hypothetical protein
MQSPAFMADAGVANGVVIAGLYSTAHRRRLLILLLYIFGMWQRRSGRKE